MGSLFGRANPNNPAVNANNPQEQRLIDQNNLSDDNFHQLIDHPKIKKTKAYKNPTLLKRNTLKLVIIQSLYF